MTHKKNISKASFTNIDELRDLAHEQGPQSEEILDALLASLNISDTNSEQAADSQIVDSQHRYDYSYTQNRELSWLHFDDRVLDESLDETVPLFERLKFVSIFHSNLDEFFMIRIGGLSDLAELKHQPVDNKNGLTPAEQIALVHEALSPLTHKAEKSFKSIEMKLTDYGIERITPETLHGDDRNYVERYFDHYLSPIISPLVIDPRHPFPNMHNGSLYLVCSIEGNDETGLIGMIEIPASLDRIVEIPSAPGQHGFRYILLEDIIRANVTRCFGTYDVIHPAILRVTRNADIDPDGEGVEEEEDYRQHMKRILKKRLRLQPVRLEVANKISKRVLKNVLSSLQLTLDDVTQVDMPLDMGYIFALEDHIPEPAKSEILFTPFMPQPSPMFVPGRSMREQVLEKDKLLFYPYQSMDTLLDLVAEAAHDDECISIRITLYRVAKKSRLCESLIAASEAGKEVSVLMELRARFDEQNNIEWAERLEDAGCTVIYGSEGFKCHSKICQISYRTNTELQRITLLGTGNFNEKTAKLYSDFMLMTAHPGIAEDGTAFFRNLSLGNLKGHYQYLGVAPSGLKPMIINGLNREIERARAGKKAYVFFKLNSLTDRQVIDKISEASQAGVKVEMIIRGISCLLPGIPGKTDNVTIRSIVGRFLEHARVYSFGVNSDTIYLSSADMMTRNTEHRVEIAYPVLDPTCRLLVRKYMHYQLRDTIKARTLDSNGEWQKISTDKEAFNSQEQLLELAYDMARDAAEKQKKIMQEAIQEVVDYRDNLQQAHSNTCDYDTQSQQYKNSLDDHSSFVNHKIATVQSLSNSKNIVASSDDIQPKPTTKRHQETSKTNQESIPYQHNSNSNSIQLVYKKRNRFKDGFKMIGIGLKTLIMGTSEERKNNRAKRSHNH